MSDDKSKKNKNEAKAEEDMDLKNKKMLKTEEEYQKMSNKEKKEFFDAATIDERFKEKFGVTED